MSATTSTALMRVLLARRSGVSRRLQVTAARGFPKGFLAGARASLSFALGEERGLIGLVAARRQPIYVPSALTDPRWLPLLPSLRSAYFAPVPGNVEDAAVLALYSEDADGFPPAHREVAELCARSMGAALRAGAVAKRLCTSGARDHEHLRSTTDEIDRLLLPVIGLADEHGDSVEHLGEDAGLQDLSRRELEVVSALQRGLRPGEIGRALGISHHTARNHLKRVYAKLGVHSQIELVSLLSGRVPPS